MSLGDEACTSAVQLVAVATGERVEEVVEGDGDKEEVPGEAGWAMLAVADELVVVAAVKGGDVGKVEV